MSKGTYGDTPTLRPGQRTKPGQLAKVGAFAIQGIRGGDGIAVTQYGNNVVISATGAAGRGGSGAGVYFLGEVTALPPVPTGAGVYFCRWLASGDGGTGDGQIWMCHGKGTKWAAQEALTSLSGTPL